MMVSCRLRASDRVDGRGCVGQDSKERTAPSASFTNSQLVIDRRPPSTPSSSVSMKCVHAMRGVRTGPVGMGPATLRKVARQNSPVGGTGVYGRPFMPSGCSLSPLYPPTLRCGVYRVPCSSETPRSLTQPSRHRLHGFAMPGWPCKGDRIRRIGTRTPGTLEQHPGRGCRKLPNQSFSMRVKLRVDEPMSCVRHLEKERDK